MYPSSTVGENIYLLEPLRGLHAHEYFTRHLGSDTVDRRFTDALCKIKGTVCLVLSAEAETELLPVLSRAGQLLSK